MLRTRIGSEAQARIDSTEQHKEKFMRSSWSVFAAILLVLPFAAAYQDQALAQSGASSSQKENDSAGQQDFLIRQTVHQVLVDIVVTDKDGKQAEGPEITATREFTLKAQ